MKRRAGTNKQTSSAAPVPAQVTRLEIGSQVLRDIRKHARTSMNAEICGVLIGSISGGRTVIRACISGEQAVEAGSHVTFTQDTWTHIYRIKDAEYPEERIAGWYHSHPGFGVFLSEHDVFIHRHFFSDAGQVAWVYDPQQEEDGCFAWSQGEIVRLPAITMTDEPGTPVVREHDWSLAEAPHSEMPPERPSSSWSARLIRFALMAISYLLVLLLGFGAGALLAPPVIVIRGEPHSAAPPPSPRPDVPAHPQEGFGR